MEAGARDQLETDHDGPDGEFQSLYKGTYTEERGGGTGH
jgi:hypothetical protein